MKKKLILVASPPACGKTYVSELIAKSVEHIVYLDKDDLADLVRASFTLSGKKMDMDGAFYIENIRPSEYLAILNVAFSALRFEDVVILNAPFGKEVRDNEYMRELKCRVNRAGAELFLIWVTASPEICLERMKKRNSDRDILKLKNWEEYIKKIDFTPPSKLKENDAVDKFIIFNTNEESLLKQSLDETLKLIKGGA